MNEQIQEIRYLVGEAWKGEYNPATPYGNANVVQDPTGLSVYRSLKPGNVGHPVTDTNWWPCIIDLSSIKAESDRIAALNQAIAQDEALRVAAEELRQQKEAEREDMQNRLNSVLCNHSNVDVYLCGHVHSFQHFRTKDSDIDYVVNTSGGKGREVKQMKGTQYCSSSSGFSVLSASKKRLAIYMIDKNGNILHTVNRTK